MIVSARNSIGTALSRFWLRQLRQLERQIPAVSAGHDIESLHRLRVALRRTRALLKTFRAELPLADARYFGAQFKWLAAVTGPVRDLDVQLQHARDWLAGQPPIVSENMVPVIAELERQRVRAQTKLARVIGSQRLQKLLARWRDFLKELSQRSGAASSPGGANRPALVLIKAAALKQCRQLVREGRAIKSSSPPPQLHRLRIRGKRLRYLLEGFTPLLKRQKGFMPLLAAIRALQTVLGNYQDGEVALIRVRELTELLGARRAVPAQTFIELGRWSHVLELRHHAARAEFPRVFCAFENCWRVLL